MTKEIIFFANGNTFVKDENGQQIPELQQSWFRLYLEFLESKNINPLDFDFILPNNPPARVIPFKIENGWNWDYKVRR